MFSTLTVQRRVSTRFSRQQWCRASCPWRITTRAPRPLSSGRGGSKPRQGGCLSTDGWNVYRRLECDGFRHEVVKVAHSRDWAHVTLPGVHGVAALLKWWIADTLQYATGGVHSTTTSTNTSTSSLPFNRRAATKRGLLFYRLVQEAARNGTRTGNSSAAPPANSITTSGGRCTQRDTSYICSYPPH